MSFVLVAKKVDILYLKVSAFFLLLLLAPGIDAEGECRPENELSES